MSASNERGPRARQGRGLRLAFYGDDFTGSTDALESLVTQGIPAVLFLDPPDAVSLKTKYPEIEALGVAGTARSMNPDEMREALRPIFRRIASLNPDFVHYKVCSTYDSAPHVGSIGVAMEIAQEVLQPTHVLHLGGAPHLGRYLAFGHLFARYGADDTVYRIDRHPVMKDHPSTPMHESDLALHLANQTDAFRFHNVPVDKLRNCDTDSPASIGALLEADDASRPSAWVFDAMEERDERTFADICRTLHAAGQRPFLVGGSSVEHALAATSEGSRMRREPSLESDLEPSGPLVVVSGSCSPMTAQQIDVARSEGFAVIDLDPLSLEEASKAPRVADALIRQAKEDLDGRRSVIVRSCDPAESVKARRRVPPERIANVYAAFLKVLADEGRLQRFAIAGGDVSSFTVRALGVTALSMKTSASPGVPLCTIDAPNSPFEGLEVALKGGQLGSRDFFVKLRDGFGPM